MSNRYKKYTKRAQKPKPKLRFEMVSQNYFQITMASFCSDPVFLSTLRENGGLKQSWASYKFRLKDYEKILKLAEDYLNKEKATRYKGDISVLNLELFNQYTKEIGQELEFIIMRTDDSLRPVKCRVKHTFHEEIESKIHPGFIDEIKKDDKETVKLSDIFPKEYTTIDDEESGKNCDISSELWGKLYPFQREGVEFGIKMKGRVLIADEMGVGKTIQALALSAVYRFNWPCLVLCPSSLKFNWRDEIYNWLREFVTESEVQILNKGSDFIYNTSKFVIVSYDLAKRKPQKLFQKNFGVCIADEAHMLKSTDSQRSLFLVPLIQSCKRTIILTGTPALSRPYELFNLLKMVKPNNFEKPKDFGDRYCDPQLSNFANKIEYKGSTNVLELNYVLRTLMIRRLKKDVLHFLPAKVRHRLEVETDSAIVKQIQAIKMEIEKKGGSLRKGINLMGMENGGEVNFGGGSDSGNIRPLISKMFTLSGSAKVKGVCGFLDDILEYKSQKFIVFCHHKYVMEEIENHLKKKHRKVGYMMIRGDTPGDLREKGVKDFQTPLTEKQESDGSGCRVAILSITAASVGLTLTESSTVIFAELYWTPALIIQAEDRAHRISQKRSVTIYYLMGKDTLDDLVYQKIKNKFNTISNVLDGENAQQYQSEVSKSIKDSMCTSRSINEFFERKKKNEKVKEIEEIPLDELDKLIMEHGSDQNEVKQEKEVEDMIDIDFGELEKFIQENEKERKESIKKEPLEVIKEKPAHNEFTEYKSKQDKKKKSIKEQLMEDFTNKKEVDYDQLNGIDRDIAFGSSWDKKAIKRSSLIEDFFVPKELQKETKRGKPNKEDE